MRAFWLIVLLFPLACSQPKKQVEDFSNVDPLDMEHQEAELYSLPHDVHGSIQSPVNILTTALEEEQVHMVKVINPHCHALDVVNTGHSVQLDFEGGTAILFDGTSYNFLQAHFHTPSEHQIDGVTYPMELHFVNHRYDPELEHNQYLVIAVLFKMGQPNSFIEKFINLIPENAHDTTSLVNQPVYLDDLDKPSHVDEYDWYHYDGSLTTRPYTETVEWLVMKDILEASPEEIIKINKLEGNNARHIQAMHNRGVEE